MLLWSVCVFLTMFVFLVVSGVILNVGVAVRCIEYVVIMVLCGYGWLVSGVLIVVVVLSSAWCCCSCYCCLCQAFV